MPNAPSNIMSPEDFLACYRDIRDTKRAKDEAAAAYKAARERFKSLGGDLNALKITEHLQGLDDRDAELRMRETLRYAAWLGLEVGTQTDLFGSESMPDLTLDVRSTHQEWLSEQAGYKAGHGGEPIDNNPNNAATPHYERWIAGWHDGQAALALNPTPKKGRP